MLIQHSIRASFLDGGNRSLALLGKDNCVAWSCTVEASFVAEESWDLASRQQVKPVIPRVVRNTANTDSVNQASIDAATKELETYKKASSTTTSLLINTISDAQMCYMRSVIEDPIVIWEKH